MRECDECMSPDGEVLIVIVDGEIVVTKRLCEECADRFLLGEDYND